MKLEIVFKDGRKETFDSIASFNVTEEQITNEEDHTSDVAQTPTEGKLFEVNPLEIDRNGHGRLFRKHLPKLTRILKNMLSHSTH